MRKFKNVSKKKQGELNKLFPDLLSLQGGECPTNYKHLSISVFDHWLDQDEATQEIENISPTISHYRDELFYTFCQSLTQLSDCYLVKLIGKKNTKLHSENLFLIL